MISVDSSTQVFELLRHVDEARQARQGTSVRLLSELTPRLQAAQEAERERERHLAPRFNVFKYVRKGELELSRMIADLLDPAGEHGQGTSFLKAMLEALPETHGRFGGLRVESAKSDQGSDGALHDGGRLHRHHRGNLHGGRALLSRVREQAVHFRSALSGAVLPEIPPQSVQEAFPARIPAAHLPLAGRTQFPAGPTRTLAGSLQHHAVYRQRRIAKGLVRDLPRALRCRSGELVPEGRGVVLPTTIRRIDHDDKPRHTLRASVQQPSH